MTPVKTVVCEIRQPQHMTMQRTALSATHPSHAVVLYRSSEKKSGMHLIATHSTCHLTPAEFDHTAMEFAAVAPAVHDGIGHRPATPTLPYLCDFVDFATVLCRRDFA